MSDKGNVTMSGWKCPWDRVCFTDLLIYLFIYQCYQFCLNSEADWGFRQTSGMELSSENRRQVKAIIHFCKKSHPRYPAV